MWILNGISISNSLVISVLQGLMQPPSPPRCGLTPYTYVRSLRLIQTLIFSLSTQKKERRNMKRHSSLYYFLYCPAHPDTRSGTANVTGDTLRYERNVPTRCSFHREPGPRRIQTPCGSRLLSRLRQARRQHSSRRCRSRRLLP